MNNNLLFIPFFFDCLHKPYPWFLYNEYDINEIQKAWKKALGDRCLLNKPETKEQWQVIVEYMNLKRGWELESTKLIKQAWTYANKKYWNVFH